MARNHRVDFLYTIYKNWLWKGHCTHVLRSLLLLLSCFLYPFCMATLRSAVLAVGAGMDRCETRSYSRRGPPDEKAPQTIMGDITAVHKKPYWQI